MTRAAILALLLLAGCSSTPEPEPFTTTGPAYELIRDPDGHVVYQPCGDGHQCALIRQGGELMVMGHPSRIGDGGDVWDVRGETMPTLGQP